MELVALKSSYIIITRMAQHSGSGVTCLFFGLGRLPLLAPIWRSIPMWQNLAG